MIVHRHAPANPAIRRVVLAQAVQFPGAAHAAQRGIQPQRHQYAGIGRGLPRPPLHRLNPLLQLRQVQAAGILPHDPRLVILRKQVVQGALLELDLIPDRVAQPLGTDPRRLGTLDALAPLQVKDRTLIHRSSPGYPGRSYVPRN